MDAAKVIEKIRSDADVEAQKIKKQADEEEQIEQAKIDEQLAEYKEQTKTLAQKAGEEKKAHILAAARMELAKEYLTEKRRILDGVFDKAREQLGKLPDKDYCKLMAELMVNAAETGDEDILVDKEERRINNEFIQKVNSRLGSDRKGNLRLADEKVNLGGGFILRRGKVKTNVSLDVLLAQARKELEIELAQHLFGN